MEGEEDARQLHHEFPGLHVFHGKQGLVEMAASGVFDVMLNGLVGIAGLAPSLAALERAKMETTLFALALANKETLVTGGRLVMEKAKAAGVPILPVDSEHSAIFQCMQGNEGNPVRRIVLTASGGPFRGFSREEMENVTVEQTLVHPNWSMGPKITVDSATMMNKGFEVVEAKWLFDLNEARITVVIHPESIIHSMVEYMDGALMAQMGIPSMKLPISYALSCPARWETEDESIDLLRLGGLHFESPAGEASRCLALARQTLTEEETRGYDSPAIVLNGANEVLVQAFLEKRIGFLEIGRILETIMNAHLPGRTENLEEILGIDGEARAKTEEEIRRSSIRTDR